MCTQTLIQTSVASLLQPREALATIAKHRTGLSFLGASRRRRRHTAARHAGNRRSCKWPHSLTRCVIFPSCRGFRSSPPQQCCSISLPPARCCIKQGTFDDQIWNRDTPRWGPERRSAIVLVLYCQAPGRERRLSLQGRERRPKFISCCHSL